MTLSEANSKALLDLAERVEASEGADQELDCLIQATTMGDLGRFRKPGTWAAEALRQRWNVPALTRSLDAAVSLLERVLPGFWWRGGTCYLSSEARVCPDHNCPTHGARLLVECPPEIEHWNEGIEVEIRPGSQGALVRALLSALLRSLASKDEEGGI